MTNQRSRTLKLSALALTGIAGTALAMAMGPDTDPEHCNKANAAQCEKTTECSEATECTETTECSEKTECTTTTTTSTTTACSESSPHTVGIGNGVLASFDPDQVVSSGDGMVIVERIGNSQVATKPSQSSRHIMITKDDGTHAVKIQINDGKVSAWLNGKKVSAKRIKQDDKSIRVLDAKGNVVAKFFVHTNKDGNTVYGTNNQQSVLARVPRVSSGTSRYPGVSPFAGVSPTPPAKLHTFVPGQNEHRFTPDPDAGAPPVMVGITMGEVPSELREFLDIDSDSAFLIENVIDGLPAKIAGLKARDIIVKINGKAPATQEGLRTLLRAKKPGDTIKLHVIRKGEKKVIPIKLEKYDASRFGSLVPSQDVFTPGAGSAGPFGDGPRGGIPRATPNAPRAPQTPNSFNFPGGRGSWSVGAADGASQEDAERALRDAVNTLRDMKEGGNFSAENALSGFEEALRALEEAAEQIENINVEGTFSLGLNGDSNGKWKLFMGDDDSTLFRARSEANEHADEAYTAAIRDKYQALRWHEKSKDGNGSTFVFDSDGDPKKAIEQLLRLKAGDSDTTFDFDMDDLHEHQDRMHEHEERMHKHMENLGEHMEHLGELKMDFDFGDMEDFHEHLTELGDLKLQLGSLDDAQGILLKLNDRADGLADMLDSKNDDIVELKILREHLGDQNEEIRAVLELIEERECEAEESACECACEDDGDDENELEELSEELDEIQNDLDTIKDMLKKLLSMHKQ